MGTYILVAVISFYFGYGWGKDDGIKLALGGMVHFAEEFLKAYEQIQGGGQAGAGDIDKERNESQGVCSDEQRGDLAAGAVLQDEGCNND